MRQSKQRALAEFEAYLRQYLNVPDGEDWYLYLPENALGDRLFQRWQKLAAAVRVAEI